MSLAFEKRYERRLSASLPVPPAVPVSTRLAKASLVFERLSLELLRLESLLLLGVDELEDDAVGDVEVPDEWCITISSIVILPS